MSHLRSPLLATLSSGWKILKNVSAIAFSIWLNVFTGFNDGAVKVHSLGYCNVVFVSCDSVQWIGHGNRREHHQTPHKLVIQTIFLRCSFLKRSKQTSVPAAIVNSFSSSRRIALIHHFPLEVNGRRFQSRFVASRNTATTRHSEIKQNRSTTKQEFSGEALSKQNIKD